MRGIGSALAAAIVLPLVIAVIVTGVLLLRQEIRVGEIVQSSKARVAYAAELVDPTTLKAMDTGVVILVTPDGELKLRRVSPGEILTLPPWSRGWLAIGPAAEPLEELVNASHQAVAGAGGYLDPWLVEAYKQGLIDAQTVETYRGVLPAVVNTTIDMAKLVYTQDEPRSGEPASSLPYPVSLLGRYVCVMWYYNATGWVFVAAIPKPCYSLYSSDYRLVTGYVCNETTCVRLDPARNYGGDAKLWVYGGYAFIAWAYKPEWTPLGMWSIGATVAWNTTAPASLAVNARLMGFLSGQYYKPVYSIGIRVGGLGLLLPQLTSYLQSMTVVRGKAALGLDYRGELVVRSPASYGVEFPDWIPYDFIDNTYFENPTTYKLYMLVFRR